MKHVEHINSKYINLKYWINWRHSQQQFSTTADFIKLNCDVSLEGLRVINPRSILEKTSEKRIRKEKPDENEFLKKPNVNYVC